MPPRMAAFSSPERGRRRMCCRSFCGLPQGQSLPNRIRSAPKARTRETKASSESICRSSGSASSRGVSEPREKDVSSRADVSASSSCTCSQQRQHELHRTDLPQRTARLFRRAAGTAGEADVIARVHDHDETERTGALENAQVFGVVQIDLLIGRVDLDAAHVGRGEAVELLLPVFVIRVDAAEGEHICDERVFVVRGGQGGKGAAGRKALRQHLLPHLQRQAQAFDPSHEVLREGSFYPHRGRKPWGCVPSQPYSSAIGSGS